MHNHFPADHDPQLKLAFAAWQEARSELGRLQALSKGAKLGQFADSPEKLKHLDSIRRQKALCERLWIEVTTAAEGRSRELDWKHANRIELQMQNAPEDVRGAFEAWAAAERQAQAAERQLLVLMQAEVPSPELLHATRWKRATAHGLLEAALQEMRQRAASLHHRNNPGSSNGPTPEPVTRSAPEPGVGQ